MERHTDRIDLRQARKEIASRGNQDRKLAGEVVVADALAPEAARRAQR